MITPRSVNKVSRSVNPAIRFQNWLGRYKWTYLLGWVFIASITLVLKLVGDSSFQRFTSLVELIAPTSPLGVKIVIVMALLVLIPLAAGWLAGILLKSMQGRKNAEAMKVLQEKLFKEMTQDETKGFTVALVNYPNAGFRSLGVITSTFKEAEGGRELASIYLPSTPDPTSGMLRVVAIEDLTMTDWAIDDLTGFHVTYGSACPKSC